MSTESIEAKITAWLTARQGAPTICAVGPVGGLAHSPEEYLEIASLVPRAQTMARAILRLEQAGL